MLQILVILVACGSLADAFFVGSLSSKIRTPQLAIAARTSLRFPGQDIHISQKPLFPLRMAVAEPALDLVQDRALLLRAAETRDVDGNAVVEVLRQRVCCSGGATSPLLFYHCKVA